MSTLEVVIWSMAAGAIGAVVLFGLGELAAHRTAAGVQGTLYHFMVLTFVFLLSGLPRELGLDERTLRFGQVLIGPCCNTFGNYWVRGWLSARQRDSLMEQGLRLSTWLSPVLGLGCLALPATQQLPAAAALCLVNAAVLLWVTTRGWLLGDRLALGMAVASLLAFFGILGLYGHAMQASPLGAGMQALIGLTTVLATCCVSLMIWARSHPHVLAPPERNTGIQVDPVTKLHSGMAIVQRMLKAQRRRLRTGRDGALIAVIVYETEAVVEQVGSAGLNEFFIVLGARIQRQVGGMNPVGRYWDRCFVTIVETIPSPAWLRTLGLRVASNLRRPIEVTGIGGERVQVRADIGVGVVHLSPGRVPPEDLLHDAQMLAEAARGMRSRAATLDPHTGAPVPVEDANLGGRRHGSRRGVPHAVHPAPASP